MNRDKTPTAGAAKISTGVPGLDDVLGGGLTPHRVYLLEGTPGTGKTTLGLQLPARGRRARRARPLHHAVRDGRRAARRRRVARLVARRHRRLRAGRREAARPRRRAVDPLSVGGRARRDGPRASWPQVERAEARAGRVRQPVGDAAAGAGPAALSPPGPGAQAFLLDPRLHRAAARRQDRRSPATCSCTASPTASISLEQIVAASSAPSAGACASSRCAASGSSGGYARLRARHRAASRSSRAWSRPSTAREFDARARSRRARRSSTSCSAAGCRAAPTPCFIGPSGVGKTTTADALHAARRSSAARRRAYYLFDEGLVDAAAAQPARSAWTSSPYRRQRASCSIAQIDPAELSPGEFAAHGRHAVERRRLPVRRDRQPQRLPAGDAGREVPAAADARAADVPQPPAA